MFDYTEAEISGDTLTLLQWDETNALTDELELSLSDYDGEPEIALSANGYELAGEWTDGRADIWPL